MELSFSLPHIYAYIHVYQLSLKCNLDRLVDSIENTLNDTKAYGIFNQHSAKFNLETRLTSQVLLLNTVHLETSPISHNEIQIVHL